jgi:hypothetical protein
MSKRKFGCCHGIRGATTCVVALHDESIGGGRDDEGWKVDEDRKGDQPPIKSKVKFV